MNMVVLPIEFEQFSFKVLAYRLHHRAHLVQDRFGKDAATVFCHKDQMHINVENAVTDCSDSLIYVNRPKYNLPYGLWQKYLPK